MSIISFDSLVALDRWRIPIWISFRNQLITVPSTMKWNLWINRQVNLIFVIVTRAISMSTSNSSSLDIIKTLQTAACATTKRMKDKETLQSSTLICQLAYAIQYHINNFLSDGVVTASIIIGGVLFASDQLLGMKQLAIGASAHFINDSWF